MGRGTAHAHVMCVAGWQGQELRCVASALYIWRSRACKGGPPAGPNTELMVCSSGREQPTQVPDTLTGHKSHQSQGFSMCPVIFFICVVSSLCVCLFFSSFFSFSILAFFLHLLFVSLFMSLCVVIFVFLPVSVGFFVLAFCAFWVFMKGSTETLPRRSTSTTASATCGVACRWKWSAVGDGNGQGALTCLRMLNLAVPAHEHTSTRAAPWLHNNESSSSHTVPCFSTQGHVRMDVLCIYAFFVI